MGVSSSVLCIEPSPSLGGGGDGGSWYPCLLGATGFKPIGPNGEGEMGDRLGGGGAGLSNPLLYSSLQHCHLVRLSSAWASCLHCNQCQPASID